MFPTMEHHERQNSLLVLLVSGNIGSDVII